MNHEPVDRRGPAETRPFGVTPSLPMHTHRTETAQVHAFVGSDFAGSTSLSTFGAAVYAIFVLAVLAVIVMRVARLDARERRLNRDIVETSRSVATVQGWAAQELLKIRDEFTVARVNDSAAEVMERRAEARSAAAVPGAPAPELEDDPEEQRTTVAMPAPVTPTAEPGDEDATSIFDRAPPLYAARHLTMRPPAPRPPLAHPDLIGCEDIADEPEHPYLAPDETTPPPRGRAALLVPAFRGPEQGGAA